MELVWVDLMAYMQRCGRWSMIRSQRDRRAVWWIVAIQHSAGRPHTRLRSHCRQALRGDTHLFPPVPRWVFCCVFAGFYASLHLIQVRFSSTFPTLCKSHPFFMACSSDEQNIRLTIPSVMYYLHSCLSLKKRYRTCLYFVSPGPSQIFLNLFDILVKIAPL